LYDLQSGKSMTHESGIFKGDNLRIPIPPLELNNYMAELRPLARMALESKDTADLVHRWAASGGSPANVAQRLVKMGQFAEALGWANLAISAEPAAAAHRRLLAGILERLGRLDDARLAIAEAWDLGPGDREVAADHGRILASYWDSVRQQRDTDTDPVSAINAGLKLAHSEASVAGDWSALAQLLAKAERLNEALDWSGRAMAAAPGAVDHPRLHASVLERLGRYKAGYRTAKRAVLLDPANPELAVDARRMFRKAMANFVGLARLV
jgi:tetratricopeptide (TPR) repeat protein